MRLLSRTSRRTQIVAGVVVVATAGASGWWLTRPEPAAAQSATTTVTRQTFKETVSASGTIEPAQQADLSFAVSGTVTKVLVKPGDRVRKGEVLAVVDDKLLESDATAKESALDAAQTQLDDDQDAGASDTQLAADEAAVLNAETQLAASEEALDDATLRSTINGTVAAVDLEVGDSTGTSAPSSTGESTAQFTVVASQRYVVDAQLSTADIDRVRKGLQAEITVTGGTETIYGTVASVGRVATAQSSGAATFPVTIDVTGKRKDVYAGSSATVEIIVKQVDDVLGVPGMAIRQDDEGTYVYRLVDGERVRTPVTTGATYGASTEITEGLAEGDEVELVSFERTEGGNGVQRGELPPGVAPGGMVFEGPSVKIEQAP
ncbi:MAG TPA: efflux RND transporter periplasmic adaptor subunit [Nocardioidaceae bacterium]|nr:efflux RND transporter periplasmic adaptor subunit [Nocardioidaceae bacterium]